MINNLPMHRIGEETAGKMDIMAVNIAFLLAMLPHFFRLPPWVSGFALFALIWRGLQSTGKLWAMPRWLLVPLVLVGGLSVFAQYWTIVGREPGLALLTVMASFKFLESKSHRDILILVFLCYFLLATHFLFGQTIPVAIYMLAVLIIITTTLITINQRDERVELIDRIKVSVHLIVLSLPIMALLFVLVPRIPGPLWGLSSEQRGGITGLSETMSPGQISDLITSNDVAFRVKFEGDTPNQNQLYWRGPIMARFNGRTWFQAKHRILNNPDLRQASTPTHYTITLEPHGKNWLFGLDIPTRIIDNSYLSTEYQLTSKKAINDLKRYSLSSDLVYQLEPDESLDYLLLASQYQDDFNPKTRALGKKWSRQFNSDIKIVTQALKMFREEEYIYTLQPPMLGKNSSDEFLFQTRRGFCEHYASSFTLLMRAAGIPARIVTGYQGGEKNEIGNYLIVRQSDAHAWSEVWLEGRGWVRIDPTAAVSPDRIELGLDMALKEGFATFKIGNRNRLLSQVLYNWDNLQLKWNDWILNYDQHKQTRFLNNLGLGIKSWGDMIITLVISLVIITGTYWLVGWYRERPARKPEYEIIINKLLKKLARSGYLKRPAEHTDEFLQRIKKEHNFEDPQLEIIFSIYNKVKYAKGYKKDSIINRFRKMAINWKVPVV